MNAACQLNTRAMRKHENHSGFGYKNLNSSRGLHFSEAYPVLDPFSVVHIYTDQDLRNTTTMNFKVLIASLLFSLLSWATPVPEPNPLPVPLPEANANPGPAPGGISAPEAAVNIFRKRATCYIGPGNWPCRVGASIFATQIDTLYGPGPWGSTCHTG